MHWASETLTNDLTRSTLRKKLRASALWPKYFLLRSAQCNAEESAASRNRFASERLA